MNEAEGVAALEARELVKTYPLADGSELQVLRRVDLRVARGETVAIVGESGCGKTTLLHLLGLLDRPTHGSVAVGGHTVLEDSSGALAALRNRAIGFVFQFHHLLREFSALENAMMPALIAGRPESDARASALELLRWVGLGERLEHRPWQLSGGEQQRVAVARALVNDPDVLLADEPSGNLDERTSALLHDLLFRIRAERGTSMVVVTHNRDLAKRADRILKLSDGVLGLLEESAP
ncbi:MAG: ABC transporter ATP-binding protein [Gemmatimonadota bacterium]